MNLSFGKEWTISRLMNVIMLQYFMSNKLLESYHDYPYIELLVYDCIGFV